MKVRSLIIIICSLALLSFPKSVLAQNNQLLPSGQTINSDYYLAGDTVQIDGDINGDAFLAGGVVTVNGHIGGDLFVVGGKVNVNGEVDNSVRIVAADTILNSPVGRNVLLICANCNVTSQATIGGSLLVGGANLEETASKIGRGFRFFGGRLYLNSEVANEAFVVADRGFLLGPKASISGTLKYTGSSEAVLETGATVAGKILYQQSSTEANYPRFFGARTALSAYNRLKPITEVFGLVVTIILGYIFLGLFPGVFEKVALIIEKRPAASLGWGIVVILMLLLATVLFAITLVGIPVSLVLATAGYIAWIISRYLIAFFLGRKIMLGNFGERRGWALLVGLVVIFLIEKIPVFGALVGLVLVLLALGAMVEVFRQSRGGKGLIPASVGINFNRPRRGNGRNYRHR